MIFHTFRPSKFWLRLVSRFHSRTVRFHCSGDSVNKPSETRKLNVDVDSLGNGYLCQYSLCHRKLGFERALVANSLNSNWPANDNRILNMEEAKELSVHNEAINTEDDESNVMDILDDGKLTYMTHTIDVTGVNQEQSSANQINSPTFSFVLEQVLLNSKNEINYDQRGEGSALKTDSDEFSVKSPCLNSLKYEDDLIMQLHDKVPDDGNPCSFENVSNKENNILNCDDDDDSLGLDTLFDGSLQCEDTSGGITDSRKRSRDHAPEDDSESDNDSLGLKNLFDEDLQYRDAERWVTPGKHKAKVRKRDKRKGCLNGLSDGDDIDTATSSANKSFKPKKKPKRIVPNYFIAIRVSNPHIHSGVKIVQDSVVSHDEKLKPALIPLATLHLTLLVVHLEDEGQIQKATEVLHQCKSSLEPILLNSALTINFTGLDHFRHQVLFVKLCGEEGIAKLNIVANIVRDTFAREGIPSTDSRQFNPHLTVMKLTRSPKLKKKGIRKIPVECYASWADLNFGEEQVSSLHLCSMNKKEKDGFYKCVATVRFELQSEVSNELPPLLANEARGDDITLMEGDNEGNSEPLLATAEVVTGDNIKALERGDEAGNKLLWSSTNTETADSSKSLGNDDEGSSEPYLMSATEVTDGRIKKMKSENLGNKKDSHGTSTNTDHVDSETAGEYAISSDSCVSGENQEECES